MAVLGTSQLSARLSQVLYQGSGATCAAKSAHGDFLGAEGVHLGASSCLEASQMQFFSPNPMWFIVFNGLHHISPFSVTAKTRYGAGM